MKFIDVYSLHYKGFSQQIMLLRMYRLNLTHKMNDPKNLILLVSYFIIFYTFIYILLICLSLGDYQE